MRACVLTGGRHAVAWSVADQSAHGVCREQLDDGHLYINPKPIT